MVLPFFLSRETCRSYVLTQQPIATEAAQTMLEEQLLARLNALLGETGTLEAHSFTARETEGMLIVTLTAECREELGYFVPAS